MAGFKVQPHTVQSSVSYTHTLTHAHGPVGGGAPGSGNPIPAGGSITPAQLFTQNHWAQWWNGPVGNYFQQPGTGEEGYDFGVPLGTAIHSHVTGTVILVDNTRIRGLGYVIQIKTPSGAIWHFQHMDSASVQRGQSISVGQVLGNSGGEGPSYYTPPGQRTQLISSGPHIEVRYAPTFNAALANGSGWGAAYWSDAVWQNPLPVIQRTVGASVASQGTAPPGTTFNVGGFLQGLFSGLLGFAGTSTAGLPTSASVQLPKVHIAPTGDVTNFLVAIDAALELFNPFNVTNAQQDTILGATFTDPISWIEGFGYNVVADMSATLWRLAMVLFGGYLIFKVANHFINFQALASTAVKGAGLAAML